MTAGDDGVPGPELRTRRLLLRRWRDADREPFAALNADPEVMAHFPRVLSRSESDALVDRIEAIFDTHGFGLWAVEPLPPPPPRSCRDPAPPGCRIATRTGCVGFVGLIPVPFEADFTPAVEVGWRLARPAWGRGFATEAALASLRFGFEVAGLDEIVSFTVPSNAASQAVMRRVGMAQVGTFEHPHLVEGDPLRTHVLYRVTREQLDASSEQGAP